MGRQYDKEFKLEAVRLASEPGNTQSGIARDLGILGKGSSAAGNANWKRMAKMPFHGKAVSSPRTRNSRSGSGQDNSFKFCHKEHIYACKA